VPGAVPRTSTMALTHATIPYALEIANKGWRQARQERPEIKGGANVVSGTVTHRAVAEAFGWAYNDINHVI